DNDGLLKTTTGAGAMTITRDDTTGLVQQTTAGSGPGVTSTATYNTFGELSTLTYSYGGTTLLTQTLTRDALGRITQVQESGFVPTHTWGYRYDLAGRLYGVTQDGDTLRTYRYDGNGNRTEERNGAGDTLATATYDAQDRMLRYGATRFTYSNSGELTSKTLGASVTSYEYDPLGNLVRTTLLGDSVTYKADGENR